MQAQAAEQAHVVYVWSTIIITVSLQPDYGLVAFDVRWQHYANATYRMLQNLVHEESHIHHHLTDPIRVWSLTHRLIEQVRLLDSFQESLDSIDVSDQARFIEVSATAVTRAMIKSVSSRLIITQDETITEINFKRLCLFLKKCDGVQKLLVSKLVNR